MAKTLRIDDVLQEAVGAGRIITGYAVVAEIVNANDEYEIITMTDGTSSPWKIEGLVSYALNNGFLSMTTDEEPDDEFEDEGDE